MGKSRKFFRPKSACAALVLCLALSSAPVPAQEDYRHSGLGNKYNGDGWEGFSGFGDEADRARERSATRAAESEKKGTEYQDKAKDLNGMGNQIGEDRNKLVPQAKQAKQLDQQNGTGSSRLQKLLSTPYKPEKYAEALNSLGLRKNGDVLTKGKSIQEQLYKRANEYEEFGTKALEQAAQGMGAAKQLKSFSDVASARNNGMSSMKTGNGARVVSAANGKGSGMNLGSSGDGEFDVKGKPNSIAQSDISAKSEAELPSGQPGSIGRARYPASIGAKVPAGEKNKESQVEKHQSRKEALARINAMPDVPLPDSSPIVPTGFLFGSGSAAAPALGSSGVSEEIKNLRASLNLDDIPSSIAGEGTDPVSVPVPVSNASESRSSLSNDAFLEEESLFTRVRTYLVRAEKEGRISQP